MNRRTLLRSAAFVGGLMAVEPLIAACGREKAGSPGGPSGPGVDPAGLVISDVGRRRAGSAHLDAAATSVRSFAADLYARVAARDGNVVCSPYSVAVALAMTRVGALAKTARQMDDVLRAGSQDEFNDGMNALSAHVDGLTKTYPSPSGDDNHVEVATANSLWGQRGEPWEEEFLDTLAADYGAGMRVVDYGDAAAVTTQINDWTSEQTHGRIPKIIPPGALDAATRLVLVNAIYLKAPWADPFEKSATQSRPFTLADGSTVQADTMSGAPEGATCGRADGCQIARLPYFGGEVAMSIVLPDGDLAEFEAGLDGDRLSSVLKSASSSGGVDVQLPKWTFRLNLPLNDVLAAMGMPAAFDPDAVDFDGMLADAGLYIGAVLHDAFIAVDEAGTEAAAATAVVMDTMSLQTPSQEFVADRPFLFVIHDTATATPLFVGRVSDPTA